MAKKTRVSDLSEVVSCQSFLIIGVGNMGSSLARGLLASQLGKSLRLRLFDQHADKLESFKGDDRVEIVDDLSKLKRINDSVVLLCTKPQDLDSLATIFAGKIEAHTLVISILAAVTLEQIAKKLNFKGAIVRAMPNIAATVGEAATAICCNAVCDTANMNLAHEIFASVGTSSWTKEALMDAVTGLSGSGPAYIYMVIEALTDGGVKMGLPRTLALELATQTVVGSARLVQTTGIHPAVLRDQVTTPAGTTIAAIHELEERGLKAMLMSAVATATERSKFLREKKGDSRASP